MICNTFFRPTIIALATILAIMLAIDTTDMFGYGWKTRATDPSKAATITAYTPNGDTAIVYQSAGEVTVSRSGCSFTDAATGQRIHIQGPFIVSEQP